MQGFGGVLAFCNDVRQQLGRQPVPHLRKGRPGDSEACVVAGTINHAARNRVSVDSYGVYLAVFTPDEKKLSDVPPFVDAFIDDFDLGRLSELEGKGWAE